MSRTPDDPILTLDEVAFGLAKARSVEDIAEVARTTLAAAVGARAELIVANDNATVAPIEDPDHPQPGRTGAGGPERETEGAHDRADAAAELVCRVPLIPDDRGMVEFRFPGRRSLEAHEHLHIKTLTALCSQALIRVDELELSSRVTERLAQLEQMSGIGLLQMKLEELLSVLPSRVANALGCETARIFLINEDGTFLAEAGSHGLTELSPPRPFAHGLTGRVAVRRKGQIFDDITREDVVGRLPENVTTVAAVPLLSEDRVVGVLDVGATAGRRFGEGDLRLLELAAARIATAIDRSRVLQAEQARRFRSEFLADLAHALDARKPSAELAGAAARLTVERLCERCVVTITGSSSRVPVRVIAERLGTDQAPLISIEGGDPGDHGRLVWEPGTQWESLTLRGPTMDIGSIEVWRREDRGHFNDDELLLLQEAANRIATAVEFHFVSDVQRSMATGLQRSLLPASLPEVTGVDLAVAIWSASEAHEVGGDFFDVFPLGDERWGVLIGDVSGKGVRAAAMTGIARHTARAASRHGHSPAEVLGWVHDAFISERETSESYCSAIFGLLSRQEAEVDFDFSVGGHPLPVLARSGRPSEFVGVTGTVLGLVDSATLHEATVRLAPGDTLLLYTDGVTDVPGDLALYDERLLSFIDGLLAEAASAATIAETIEDRLKVLYRDIRQDDTIVLVLRNEGDDTVVSTGPPAVGKPEDSG